MPWSSEIPSSYRDPFWTQKAASAEKQEGIPEGLLQSILLFGERTNVRDSQGREIVSTKGARTPFQIIPETRAKYLKEKGVDAYASPDAAARVASMHIKDSLTANKNDIDAAISEYFAGSDRKNWGPKTREYHANVKKGLEQFNQKFIDTGTARAYAAYAAGEMGPEAAAAFEEDVNAGILTLPAGATLRPIQQTAPTDVIEATPALIEAYRAGQLTPEQKSAVDSDIQSGALVLPAGMALQAEAEPATTPTGLAGAVTRGMAPVATGTMLGAGLGTLIGGPAGAAAGAGLGAGAGGLAYVIGDPLTDLINSQFGTNYQLPSQAMEDLLTRVGVAEPKTAAERIVQSATQAAASTAAPLGIGSALAKSAGPVTQAVGRTLAAEPIAQIVSGAGSGLAEAGAREAGVGPSGQLAAGVAGGLLPGIAALGPALLRQSRTQMQTPLVQALIDETPTISPVEQALPEIEIPGTAEPGATRRFAPREPMPEQAIQAPDEFGPEPSDLTMAEMGRLTRKAATGSILTKKKAIRTLADFIEVDEGTYEAAQRLGIEKNLQPDHLTTNQAVRAVFQAVKSEPGSVASAQELNDLKIIGQEAEKLVNQMGATRDLSSLSSDIYNRLDTTISGLEKKANDLYGQVRKQIPSKTRGPATNVLKHIGQRVDELGGNKADLKPIEKKILQQLSPRKVVTEGVEGAEGVEEIIQPTYALIDDVRKDIGDALFKNKGPYKDGPTDRMKILYGLLLDDQRAIVEGQGALDLYDAASASVSMRKALEDDSKSLFGKQLGKTIVSDLQKSTKQLSKGEIASFMKMMKAIPVDMRQETTASALRYAFGEELDGKKLNPNSFAKWYRGLKENKQAYNAVMTNLPKGSAKILDDLFMVSDAIAKASKERIRTGLMQSAEKQLEANPDGLLYKIFTTGVKVAGAEGATSLSGLPGAGTASVLTSAFKDARNKTTIMEAADKLLASKEFKKTVIESAKRKKKGQ